jgi:hypothetical protein
MKNDSNILRVSFPIKHTEKILFNVFIDHCSLTENIQQQIRQSTTAWYSSTTEISSNLTKYTFTLRMPDNCCGKHQKGRSILFKWKSCNWLRTSFPSNLYKNGQWHIKHQSKNTWNDKILHLIANNQIFLRWKLMTSKIAKLAVITICWPTNATGFLL